MSPNVTIADEYLQHAILPLSSILVTGELVVLIPRDVCSSITHLCLEILPGYNSSYSLGEGYSHVTCLDLSPYKNCLGKSAFYIHAMNEWSYDDLCNRKPCHSLIDMFQTVGLCLLL